MGNPVADLIAYNEAVACEHDLKAVTLQIIDRSRVDQTVMQIAEFMIPAEANWNYREQGVHLEDPFTSLEAKEAPEHADDESLLDLQDPHVSARAANAPAWRHHLDHFAFSVEGVSVRRLRQGVYLLAGFLRDASRHYAAPVPRPLLQSIAGNMHNMMSAYLLHETLHHNMGLLALRNVLEPENQPAPLEKLSAREMEVAHHVAMGRDSKEVAWRMQLSKFTVDNHLRRIYAKLGIRNRASLARLVN